MNALDGSLIAAAGSLLMLALAAVLGVETYLLAKRRPPITTYTRNAIEQWPGPSLTVIGAILFSIGALFAHFVWDAVGG